MNRYFLALLSLGCLVCPDVLAADNPIVPADAQLEKLWCEGTFTEGPAYGPGACIYFTDIGNRIMKYDPAAGRTTVFREPSGRANGLDFDPQGRLVACEGGSRHVSITDKDGSVRTLVERFEGKRFNSPNDVTIDTSGRVYFSDPRFSGTEPRELDHQSVYRIETDGTVKRLLTDVDKPNGVLLAPDMKTLYVADNQASGNRLLLAYPLRDDGSVGPRKMLHDFGKNRGIDGMCADVRGNIYGTAGVGDKAGVYVFDSAGKQLAFIATPETPTNCVFGGKERKTLYITAGKSLYRIPLQIEGFAVFWPKD